MEAGKQQDLDVLFVIRSMKNGIRYLIRSVISLIDFSIKNFWVLLIFSVLGGFLGFLDHQQRRPYYKSDFTVSHIRFENDYCIEMINNLNSYVYDDDRNSELAKKLKIDPTIAARLKCIRYKPFNEHKTKMYSDSISVLIPFKIEVEVYDNEILVPIQNAIIDYMESNEYVLTLKEIDKQALDLVEKKMNDEIAQIDSLKRIVDKSILPRTGGNGIILGEAIEPVLIYKRSMDSYEKLMSIHKKQKLNNSFQLMVPVTPSGMSEGWKRTTFLTVGTFIGYLVGLLFLSMKNNIKNGRHRRAEEQ